MAGNMYDWVDICWNPVKGQCGFHCSYCYVPRISKRFGKAQAPIHIDEKQIRRGLGKGKTIFVCSGCDLFAPVVPDAWIKQVTDTARDNPGNTFLWHTKNPERAVIHSDDICFPQDSILCTTIETNRQYGYMGNTPAPEDRAKAIRHWGMLKMITVEPVIDFDLTVFAGMILSAHPDQVNIGADTGGNHLPEPYPLKVKALIERLEPYTKVHLKKNLRRLLPV